MTAPRDRIVGLKRLKASLLKPHPQNFRRHGEEQKSALRAVLADVGWVDAVIARKKGRGYELLDGHLRAEIDPEAEIPVLVVDLTDDEAKKVLATHDPLGYLAETDPAALNALLADIEGEIAWLEETLEAGDAGGETRLKELAVPNPPTMCWVLVGIPTVKYGGIAPLIEQIAAIEETFVEAVLNDHEPG